MGTLAPEICLSATSCSERQRCYATCTSHLCIGSALLIQRRTPPDAAAVSVQGRGWRATRASAICVPEPDWPPGARAAQEWHGVPGGVPHGTGETYLERDGVLARCLLLRLLSSYNLCRNVWITKLIQEDKPVHALTIKRTSIREYIYRLSSSVVMILIHFGKTLLYFLASHAL